jgi:large subunit ribosomal protein L17
MRHAKKGRPLGSDASHTTAIKRGLARALFTNERIKTTETRAKEVRNLVDRIIGWGKRGDVHARRLAMAELGDKALVHKIFADIAPRYAERNGGYTRILKLGPRKGDAAPMVIMELVEQ